MDKSKYTLGKWVDTIIVQMNDPSIDDIELDDSIKRSNFNMVAAIKEKEREKEKEKEKEKERDKEKEEASLSRSPSAQQSDSRLSGQTLDVKPATRTQEFEYYDNANEDDNDEEGVSERDYGKHVFSPILTLSYF